MERRLAAILAVDMVGYSRLMGKDEAGTLKTLKTHRKELFEPKEAQYHGRTIKLMGDGALMEFGSVVEAIAFAVEIQCATDADSLHVAVVERWSIEIDRLAKLRAVSPDGATALKSAQAFIGEGWALQAARLGWDENQLFGVCPCKPWVRLDRKGVAFGSAVQAVTQDAVAYVGGLRRYRAQVNNDNGAVPIWELAQGNPQNGGDAA